MFDDEMEEKPESLRMKKIKELIDQLQMMTDSASCDDESQESPEMEMSEHEKPALEIAVIDDKKPKV